jgi:hypothetical protein
MRNTDELRQVLATVISHIGSADQKAAALLTIAGVLIAFPAPTILVPAQPSTIPLFSTVCATASACAFVVSICAGLMVLFPRTKNKTDTSSLIYFGDIAAMTKKAYTAALDGADDARLRDDVIAQIYINSEIACAKHSHFKVAVAALITGIGLLSASYVGIAATSRRPPAASAPTTTAPLPPPRK